MSHSTQQSSEKVHHVSRRLTLSLVLTVTFIATITIALIYIRTIEQNEKELQTKADEYLANLIGVTELPLWTYNKEIIELIGKAFTQNELVMNLNIRDSYGEELFLLAKKNNIDGVSRSGKVFHKGEFIGVVEFVLTKEIYKKNAYSLLLSYGVGTLFILITLILVTGFFIRKFLRKPLDLLNTIVDSYASGTYDTEIKPLPYYEFRPFGNVLALMGKKINEQMNRLQKAELRYRSIFENAVEGIFQSTPGAGGQFIRVNPAHARILGYDSPEQLMQETSNLGRQFWVNPKDREIFSQQVAQGPINDFEIQLRRRDGQIIWASFNARPVHKRSGELDYIEGIMLDITDRKQADKKLDEYRQHLESLVNERTAELTLAKEEAEAANAAKSDFLARMSHEIRTPLNAVIGLTNIVLKSNLTTEQQDYLNKVRSASGNLLEVINDILDFSKVEAGQLELSHSLFDLDQVMEQLADLFSTRVATKDLELIFTVDPHLPRQMIGDPGRLTQVLTNLIENAVKFTESGEITISVKPDDPGEKMLGQTAIKFQVCDSGSGISPDALPTLFDPFTQAEDYISRRHEGTGLGLAICKRLVELMGGYIWAESGLGKGSTFSFMIMLDIQEQEKPPLCLPADLQDLRILVADDSTKGCQVLADILQSFDSHVFTADTGEKTIEAFNEAATDKPFQLVLLDWRMPDMDCFEIARRLRELEAQSNEVSTPVSKHGSGSRAVPIIILATAYGYKTVQDRLPESPANKALLKPVKPSQLYNTIMESVGHKKTTSPVKPLTANHHEQLTDRRALVVEDSELNRDVAIALLNDLGMIVEIAENGIIAVEKVTGAPAGYYDIVFMDIQMPLMDGFEATRQIRRWEADTLPTRTPSRTSIPIIALTAHALAGEKEKCLGVEMDDYLVKPIDEKQLKRVLLQWTAQRKEKEEQSATMQIQTTAPVLDVEGALKRLGGRKAIYLKALKRFDLEYGRAYESVNEDLAAGAREAAVRTVHTVKGTAATIGATELNRLAAKLEKVIGHGEEDPSTLLDALKDELVRITCAIVEYLKDESQKTTH